MEKSKPTAVRVRPLHDRLILREDEVLAVLA